MMEAVEDISNSCLRTSLTYLNLYSSIHNRVSDRTVGHILPFERLEKLKIGGNQIGMPQYYSLLAKVQSSLTVLNISWATVNQNPIKPGYCEHLNKLTLRRVINGHMFESLLKENYLPSLTYLDCSGTENLYDVNLTCVSLRTSLRSLILRECEIGALGFFYIGAAGSRLRYLDLEENEGGSKGLENLATSTFITTLSFLNVSSNKISSISSLYKHHFPYLMHLDLRKNPIPEVERNVFAAVKPFPHLVEAFF